ncbi:hypothetical protein BDK51DRAFT_32083 [Blyttiomyces helicus]|uniref:Uncharacterized protein n=1 Tax=Blyttiomyces helicus TaxID=388810 RepID=A0A4P9WN97_9FUNG|nr:hypothetical protein BDK51DRAFT_32083 [Blyttiomyces helicus]|eukprot:RKO94591.1 hypothetical protein BDK51DRAFT_32083 [Blyttiomyces helicus]
MISGLVATPATAPLASTAFATLSGLSPLVFPVVAALAATGVMLFAVNGLGGKYIASLPDSSGDQRMSILIVNERTQEVSATPIPQELIPEVTECVGYLRDENFTAENKKIIDVLAKIPALTSANDQLENSRSEELINAMPEHESNKKEKHDKDESRKDERHEKDGIGLRDAANSSQGDKDVPSLKVEKVVIKKLDEDFVREPVAFISIQRSKSEINDLKISNISALPNGYPGDSSIDSRMDQDKNNIGKLDGVFNSDHVAINAFSEKSHQIEKPSNFLIGMVFRNRNRRWTFEVKNPSIYDLKNLHYYTVTADAILGDNKKMQKFSDKPYSFQIDTDSALFNQAITWNKKDPQKISPFSQSRGFYDRDVYEAPLSIKMEHENLNEERRKVLTHILSGEHVLITG